MKFYQRKKKELNAYDRMVKEAAEEITKEVMDDLFSPYFFPVLVGALVVAVGMLIWSVLFLTC